MRRAYKNILEEGVEAYGIILRQIASNPDTSILVHCTAGKDRTGVLCALLLSLAGAPDQAIAEEYALTESGLGPWLETLVQAVLKTSPHYSREGARRMAGARKQSILAALQTLKSDYGGAEGYVRAKLGLGEGEIAILKRALVVENAPVCGVI